MMKRPGVPLTSGRCLSASESNPPVSSLQNPISTGASNFASQPMDVVVFSRDGGGHVGFVVGQHQNGDLMVLGGNQSDAINIRAFSRSRVTGYRWPVNEPRDSRMLPLMNGTSSVKES